MKINCRIHSKERQLLGLRRQLNNPRFNEKERKQLLKEITALEKELGLQTDESSKT